MRIANKIHVTKNQLHFHGAVINGRVEWLRKYSRKTIPYEKYYVLQVKGDSGKPLFLYKFARMSDKNIKKLGRDWMHYMRTNWHQRQLQG
jgi:hypothetical protein